MATSTLLQTEEQPPEVNKGHGTAALGPSDTSDSGSDVQGGPGLHDNPGLGLDSGTYEDSEGTADRSAGQDLGDSNLDSDSDSGGSGERGAAGRDLSVREANDLYPDHVEGPGGERDAESIEEAVDAGTNQTDIDLGPRERRHETDAP
jgi:hypothetical protein